MEREKERRIVYRPTQTELDYVNSNISNYVCFTRRVLQFSKDEIQSGTVIIKRTEKKNVM